MEMRTEQTVPEPQGAQGSGPVEDTHGLKRISLSPQDSEHSRAMNQDPSHISTGCGDRGRVHSPNQGHPSLHTADAESTHDHTQNPSAESTADTKSTRDHSHPNSGHQWELIFALLSGVTYFSGLLAEFAFSAPPQVSLALYLATYFFGGYFTVKEAWSSIRRGKFEVDFLMIAAALGAAAVGKFAEGAVLLFLFSLGHALEEYAMSRATRSIDALAELAPRTALVKTASGGTVERPVEDLAVGDTVAVLPHTRIPADGIVTAGIAVVDQSAVTGESIPVEKFPVPLSASTRGATASATLFFAHSADPTTDSSLTSAPPHEEQSATSTATTPQSFLSPLPDLDSVPSSSRVFAGTLNGASAFDMQVTAAASDTTLARVVQMVRDADTAQSPTQRFVDRFQRYYVPAVILGTLTVLLVGVLFLAEPFSASFFRSMLVLVAASPCALAIATPAAVLAAIARAGRAGILVKGGAPLEVVGKVDAMAFDKTGTLTWGRPTVTDVLPAPGVSTEELCAVTLAVESLSDHPLASAITRDLEGTVPPAARLTATDVQALTGRGIRASITDRSVLIGNARLVEEAGVVMPPDLATTLATLHAQGRTTMTVLLDGRVLGILGVMDVWKKEAEHTIQVLRELEISTLVMISGDNQQVADAIGDSVGVDRAIGELLPEDKVMQIRALEAEGCVTAMVGDGVNDSPAMAAASVGIAMGAAGSAVVLETADIALMSDDLGKLPFLIRLSRATTRIIRQNLIAALVIVVFLVPASLAGLSMGPIVLIHEGSTILVILNALRLLQFHRNRDHAGIVHEEPPEMGEDTERN